jgi:hypothetical protein
MGFAATALRISSGVIAWAAHFAVVYGVTALACARGIPGAVPWTIGLATLAAAAFVVVVIVREWKRREDFAAWLAAALAATALLAIVFEGLPVLLLTPCD